MSRLPRPLALALGYVGPAVLLLVLTQLVLDPQGAGRGTPAAIVFQGVVSGMLTALTAAGIVLVYRSIRIVNFSAAALGAAGSVFAVYMVGYVPGCPFVVTFALSLGLGALSGAIVDLAFGRRFARAPRLVLTVVSIQGASLLFIYSVSFITRAPWFPRAQDQNPLDLTQDRIRRLLPFPGFSFRVGSLPLRFGFIEVLAIEVAVVALVALGLFFRFTRTGTAVRASAENAERAALLGISTGGVGTIVWVIAGVLAAAGGSLNSLAGNPGGVDSRGFSFLFPPLAAAVLARFRSFSVAVYASVGIGIFSAAMAYAFRDGTAELYTTGTLLLLVVGGLVVQRRSLFRLESAAASSWSATEEPRPVPKELLQLGGVRAARIGLVGAVLAVTLAFPFFAPVRYQVLGAGIAINAIAALSLVVLTGWSGQVSLGQWAFVGVGALIAGQCAAHGLSFWLGIPVATLGSAAVALLVGLPALRIKGLFLAVATFGFAVVVGAFLSSGRFGGHLLKTGLTRPKLVFLDFDDERSMYYLCLAGLVAAIALIVNLRRSRFGRLLIAVRENEANVQTFGIRVARTKLYAFMLAGGLAGFAGSLLEIQARGVDGRGFDASVSFTLFIVTVLGGVSAPAGALLGSGYQDILTFFFSSNFLVSILAPVLPLLLLYAVPGGFLALLLRARDAVLRIVAQRRQLVVPSLFSDQDPEALARRLVPMAPPSTTDGLAVLAPDQRYALASDLYGAERPTPTHGPVRASAETAAIAAAVEAEPRPEPDLVGAGRAAGPGPTTDDGAAA